MGIVLPKSTSIYGVMGTVLLKSTSVYVVLAGIVLSKSTSEYGVMGIVLPKSASIYGVLAGIVPVSLWCPGYCLAKVCVKRGCPWALSRQILRQFMTSWPVIVSSVYGVLGIVSPKPTSIYGVLVIVSSV